MSTLQLQHKVEGKVENRVNQNKSGLMDAVYQTLLNKECTLMLINSQARINGFLRASDMYSILFEENMDGTLVQYHHILKSAIACLSFDNSVSSELAKNMDAMVPTKNVSNKKKNFSQKPRVFKKLKKA